MGFLTYGCLYLALDFPLRNSVTNYYWCSDGSVPFGLLSK